MIDTHCHLCDKRFDRDREDVLRRAFEAGVQHFVEIAYAPEIVPRAMELAREHPALYVCVGVHPSESGRVELDYASELREYARHPRVVAIGETGFDFHRDHSRPEDQEAWFRAQIEIANELGLPLVIHQRSALEPTLALLEETRPPAGGVLHCFDDGVPAAGRAHALGFKLGIGGCLTYGHEDLDDAVRDAADGMLLLETDSPYLEPEPRSLKRNEPALLPRVVKRLCELKGWTPEEAIRITSANARELFRLPIPDGPVSRGPDHEPHPRPITGG